LPAGCFIRKRYPLISQVFIFNKIIILHFKTDTVTVLFAIFICCGIFAKATFFTLLLFLLGMHRILFLPDIRPARYPANPKAGYRISGKGRIPDIRPDTWLDNYIFGEINKFIKTVFLKHLYTFANIKQSMI
jgi:hypothetical protein